MEGVGERFCNQAGMEGLSLALAGSVVLIVGMGYGRFAYTGILPLMLNEQLLTLREGNLPLRRTMPAIWPARCCWRKPGPRTPGG
jgi:hypothetical protein